ALRRPRRHRHVHRGRRHGPGATRAGAEMNARFEPASRLRGRLTPPPDKSISHRAALVGAMASDPVCIRNYLHAADTESTLHAIGTLGAIVERRHSELVIRGGGLRNVQPPTLPIYVGNAGTLM